MEYEEEINAAVQGLQKHHAMPLSESQKVLVMQAWNVVVARNQKTAFAEALLFRWRVLASMDFLEEQDAAECKNKKSSFLGRHQHQRTASSTGGAPFLTDAATAATPRQQRRLFRKAIKTVERNQDPIHKALRDRMFDAPDLVMGLLDEALRALCPHTQRGSHLRPLAETSAAFSLECHDLADYFQLLARVGVAPRQWFLFGEAFYFAMRLTGADDPDVLHDLTGGTSESSVLVRAVVQQVSLPALEAIRDIKSLAQEDAFKVVLPRFWGRLTASDKNAFGELFYRRLFSKHPDVMDYFTKTDMDSLCVHLMMSLDLVVASVADLGSDSSCTLRATLDHLGEVHRRMGVPTCTYALVGGVIVECLQPLFQAEELLLNPKKMREHKKREGRKKKQSMDSPSPRYQNNQRYKGPPTEVSLRERGILGALFGCFSRKTSQKNDFLEYFSGRETRETANDWEDLKAEEQEVEEEDEDVDGEPQARVTAADMTAVFVRLYVEVMSIVYYPMLKQEKTIEAAKDFYKVVQEELQWSVGYYSKRLVQVEIEIAATGTYHQTEEELQVGAWLAFRNSAKCIGRGAWNDLVVRDMRQLSDPYAVLRDVEEHLKEATKNKHVKPVLTVYPVMDQDEVFGSRFWSDGFLRYAGYVDEDTEMVLGDPANVELTDYLMASGLWSPPELRSRFDVLPVVLKVPRRRKPVIYQLPSECIPEVPIEHPTNRELSRLGLKWFAIPTCANFQVTLGGITYQAIPFSGWFVSSAIVRSLLGRYDVGAECAAALGIDVSDSMCRQQLECELERAVLYSYKKQGYRVDDPYTAAEEFGAHVRRERNQYGRECPGQWSHVSNHLGAAAYSENLELRNFYVAPLFEKTAPQLLLHLTVRNDGDDDGGDDDNDAETVFSDTDSVSVFNSFPNNAVRPLILYGSETGNAERVARDLRRRLKLLDPVLKKLNDATDLTALSHWGITHVFCVCSTFAEGDPPRNAEEFFLLDLAPFKLSHLKFCVLALGSSIYPNFCQAGLKLDRKLCSAGLERMCTVARADAASDGAETIANWTSLVQQILLPSSLEEELNEFNEMSLDDPPLTEFNWLYEEDMPITNRNAVLSRCLSNVELLDPVARQSRSVRRITFEHPATGPKYQTGDRLSVRPFNSAESIHRFLKCFEDEIISYGRASTDCPLPKERPNSDFFDWQVQQMFTLDVVSFDERKPADVLFDTPTNLKQVIAEEIDLSLDEKNLPILLQELKSKLDSLFVNLKKDESRKVSRHASFQKFEEFSNPILKESGQTETVGDAVASFPTIAAFLEHFKELFCDKFTAKVLGWSDSEPIIKLAELLTLLPRLQPRFYSIASSSKVSPNEISISVAVLETETKKKVPVKGVCSQFLAGLHGGIDGARITVCPAHFRLPENALSPLIMVAAGTGVAPMIGLLEDRALALNGEDIEPYQIGPVYLFFGCRTDHDFIHEKEIKRHENNGMINLHLALSRSPDCPKTYVQDKILESGMDTCDLLLNPYTHYYVCGDARMAESSFEACVEVLREHNSMSRVSAAQHLKQMRSEARWHTDVWGIVSHFEIAKKEIALNQTKCAKVWMNRFVKPSSEEKKHEEDSGSSWH